MTLPNQEHKVHKRLRSIGSTLPGRQLHFQQNSSMKSQTLEMSSKFPTRWAAGLPTLQKIKCSRKNRILTLKRSTDVKFCIESRTRHNISSLVSILSSISTCSGKGIWYWIGLGHTGAIPTFLYSFFLVQVLFCSFFFESVKLPPQRCRRQ